MEGVPLMDEDEIQQRVQSLAGPHAKILDCEKKSSFVTEEVLLLNGQPVHLTGKDGERIKAALKAGLPPPPEILSEILLRTGIQSGGVQIETTTTVKSNTKTSEVSTLTDSQGQTVDEKMKEFEEDDEFESTNVEIWEKDPSEQANKAKAKIWDLYKEATYENVPSSYRAKQPPKTPPPPPPTTPTRSYPGRMPHLSTPTNPKLRPPVPPKPAKLSGYVGSLRTDKNISIPVRVVYETFI